MVDVGEIRPASPNAPPQPRAHRTRWRRERQRGSGRRLGGGKRTSGYTRRELEWQRPTRQRGPALPPHEELEGVRLPVLGIARVVHEPEAVPRVGGTDRALLG